MSGGGRPALMAIGDSLYQGVRSLSFTSELGRHSPPAQVAAALGVALVTPNPRLPILFDLEALIRQGEVVHLVAAIRHVTLANMQAWLGGDAWSQYAMFDNVAVGGAEIASLYEDSYAAYWPQLAGLVAKIQASQVPDLTSIWSLWYALNVCFTLNPLHREEQAGQSQIDQVLQRQPRMLLVNIGSNEGLFDAGFMGAVGDATFTSIQQIPQKMRAVGERLAALPADTVIAFNSLIRPRTAANLMPAPDATGYPGDGYFTAYGPRIGSTQQDIPGAVLKQLDELVAEVNADTQANLRQQLGARLRWVDLYAASTAIDGKHYQNAAVMVQPKGDLHSLRNVPLLSLFGHMLAGGLAGVDNMHPTAVGYAAIADAVLQAMGSSRATDRDAAFLADTLLTGLPLDLTTVQAELALVGAVSTFTRSL
jgi:lysophospholipase L1-like esterase